MGIALVALLGFLTLGQSSLAGTIVHGTDGPPPENSLPTALTDHVQFNLHAGVGQFGGGTRLRSHKHSHAFPKIASEDDPNDDETSDDPNDDVLWDDPTDHDPGVPIIACLHEAVSCLDAGNLAPAAWTAHAPSPFLILGRLRC
jgi:hypothetical protein